MAVTKRELIWFLGKEVETEIFHLPPHYRAVKPNCMKEDTTERRGGR